MGSLSKKRGETEAEHIARLEAEDEKHRKLCAESEERAGLSFWALMDDIDMMKNGEDLRNILRKFAKKLGED